MIFHAAAIRARLGLLAGLVLFTACDRIMPRAAPELPPIEAARQIYTDNSITAEFRYSGNVLELVVQQPIDQLQRGGPLWARVGPYIYLFSPGTQKVFAAHPAIAGIRVITQVGDTEVARALLVRDALNELTWPRAIRLLSTALQEGTERPSTMDRLVQFGEEHTTHEYNPRYVRRR